MSHIAFDLDALPLVPKVARSAGIGEAVVGWGLTQMWEWCWREKTDKVTTNHLRGFFGTELGAIMVDFGFLEAIGSGVWRVRGAARYLRIQEGRERGGRNAKGNLKQYQPKLPSGTRDAVGQVVDKLLKPDQPKTVEPVASHRLASGLPPADDRHTSRHTSRLDTGLSATSDERLALEAIAGQAPPAAKKSRKPSAQEQFFGWTQDELSKIDPRRVPEKPPDVVVLNSQLKDPLDAIGRKGLELAWRAFVKDAGAATNGWPWAWFVKQWPKHHNAALRNGSQSQPIESLAL